MEHRLSTNDLVIEDPFVMPFSVGEVVAGKYEVTALIGTGGVGFVVSAIHLGLGESVALKFLRSEFTDHAEAVSRFTTEARANFKIKSPHVVRVLDVGALPSGAPFMVMELLEGRDIRDVLAAQNRFPQETAVEYLLQTCEALATAHACQIIHRDVKPENLFLTKATQGEQVKVLDFGISKMAICGPADRRFDRSKTVTALGSPPYMSPEQIRAAADIDARTDIWSVGCVLYELLSGKPAFDAPSLMQVCAAVLETEPAPLRTLVPEIAPELERVVVRCLQKDRTRRYQDIAELAAALAPFAPPRAQVLVERCAHALRGERSRGPDSARRVPDITLTTTRPEMGAPVSVAGVSVARTPTGDFRGSRVAVALLGGVILALAARQLWPRSDLTSEGHAAAHPASLEAPRATLPPPKSDEPAANPPPVLPEHATNALPPTARLEPSLAASVSAALATTGSAAPVVKHPKKPPAPHPVHKDQEPDVGF